MKKIITLLFAIATLSGCAASTTKSDFEECPEVEGVPACIDTFEADQMGDIKKDNGAAKADSAQQPQTAAHKTQVVRDKQGKRHKEITVKNDRSVQRAALVQLPTRESNPPQRMWFAPYVDEENDILVDQQYIHWQEKGVWQLQANQE